MNKIIKNVINYTCKNTEQLGIMVEKELCNITKTKFNTKRKYIDMPEEISDDINKTLGGDFKRMKMKHVGHLNKEYDFLKEKGRTVSIKTIMTGNKICPQTIGQCSLRSLNNKMSLNIDNKLGFKKFFLKNKVEMIEHYLKALFCCDTMVVFQFRSGIVYIIEKIGDVSIKFETNHSLEDIFTTSKDIYSWKESNTIYFISKNKKNKDLKESLGEIQIHNNRDCIKFRFNVNVLIDMINRGDIKNLKVKVYNLKNKYNFKIDNMKNNELCFRSFNYIGSKMKLLDFIESKMTEYTGKRLGDISSFADIFSGTGVVAYHSLKRGCKKILTNDIQNYAYVVSSVWTTKNIDVEKVKNLLNEINSDNDDLELNNIKATEDDFIYNNYTDASNEKRMYLTPLNGYKVDKTRQKLNKLLNSNVINQEEFNLMLKILLYSVTGVSNIASVYGAYLKKYKPCSLKSLKLDVTLINSMIQDNTIQHSSYNMDVVRLLNVTDLSDYEVVYIDPPYVANRSYHDNYHLLETISKYDYPEIKGKTGLRSEITTKSKFCSKRDALEEFKLILGKIRSKYIFISYSSESIVSKEKMLEILKEKWRDVRCYEQNYQRFKSNKNSDEKQSKNVVEYLFCGKLK